MAVEMLNHQMRRLVCAALALSCQSACSAQMSAASPSGSGNTPSPIVATRTGGSAALQAGEYITQKGWGRLLLNGQSGALTFSLESITGEDTCGLDGVVQGDQGIAKGENNASNCTVKFTSTPLGIDVSATTPVECKTFCGFNGGFEGPYLRVKPGCGRSDLDRTRDVFQRLYDGKEYKAALSTLSPALANCLPTLEWEQEGAIRNDVAIAHYKNGLYAQCLVTLDPYSEAAKKDDAAVVEGWTPVLADRYLSIVKRARTTIALCGRNAERVTNKPCDGE